MGKKDKYYLSVVSLMICVYAAAVYLLLYIPCDRELYAVEKKISSNKEQLRILRSFSDRYEKKENTAGKIEEINLFWKNKLPDQKNEAVFISSLQEAAAASNIVLSSVEPVPQSGKNDLYEEIIIKIKTKGDYFQVLDFLEKINGLDRYNIVDKINIAVQGNLLETDMDIRIFSISPK
ncbi:type IV pilus inner membrane component PilO [Pectinatus haikarae]|uniref:type 4a pilus biogenesis protein PilO n=1 Tax=Pectinatus haikarae TaxID=349096 RepID=UPI0018C6B2AE|nr:type 4a pilus biogenesis protein PilO [Pectinatus haikarae]